MPRILAGNQHCQAANTDCPGHLRVDRSGRHPGAVRFFHDLYVGRGNVGAVDFHLGTQARLINGNFCAFGELIKRREYHADARVGAQHGTGLVGDRVGNRRVERAKTGLLDDARIRRLDLGPDLVAQLHRGKTADVHVSGIELRAVVFDCLLQRQTRQCVVVLLDLSHVRVVQVDVKGHYLDALGHGFIDRVLEGFGQAQLHDDAVDPQINRLLNHLALTGCLLPRIENPQRRTQGFGLFLDALQIRLGEVAGKQITDHGNLHIAFVEGRGGARQAGCLHAQSRA